MIIEKLKIKNFKCFNGWYTIEFKEGLNILVGNNGVGKSTILEAINLALLGSYRGKNIRNEITQYLFNRFAVEDWHRKVLNKEYIELPEIIIEVYFKDMGSDSSDYNRMEGDNNSEKKSESGIIFKIALNEDYSDEYKNELWRLNENQVISLPIEYYEVTWLSFARQRITSRNIPVKTSMIDSTSYTPSTGADYYISKILRNLLEEKEIISISAAHRSMKENFANNNSVKIINDKLASSYKEVKLAVDFGNNSSWENSLITQLSGIPYNNIGKGQQCILKTKLALGDEKLKDKNVIILMEEPECHLSHTNLNILLKSLDEINNDSQMIITTHSSFVANKLGLENLILLYNQEQLKFNNLQESTNNFFKKIEGYDTLRMILSKKIILVEGNSDELVVQRAYMDEHEGKLPIEDGIDVMSVGTTFLRFLEIASKLRIDVVVVTDNDGNIEKLKDKYSEYSSMKNIEICYDNKVYSNYPDIENENTLEPCIVRANNLNILNDILQKKYKNEKDLIKYMLNNKVEVAFKIFESDININYPEYIKEAIK